MKRLLLLLIAAGVSSASAATFTVTNTADFGAGSLRQAITSAAGTPLGDATAHRIEFNIPGTGVQTITVASALPPISPAAVIDGYTQPGSSMNTSANGNNAQLRVQLSGASTSIVSGLRLVESRSVVRGLIINGFNFGISVERTGSRIEGNFIGTDPTGTQARPNIVGVNVDPANDCIVGGTSAEKRNVISGNTNWGVQIASPDTTRNFVQGNFIGTQADGLSPLGNGMHGIFVGAGTSNNIIGALPNEDTGENVIAFNGQNGVHLPNPARNIFISRNSIHSNGALGIDLNGDGITPNDNDDVDTGANGLQNHPVLETATRAGDDIAITGRLSTTPEATFYIEFFGNTATAEDAVGDGQLYLGSTTVTTGPGGLIRFDLDVASRAGVQSVSATATNATDGSTSIRQTSEFSAPVQLFPAGKVQNLSTRLRVETGEQVLIGGFIVTGTEPKKVILRAIGPSLRTSEFADVLADPTLQLYRGDDLLAENDNWREGDEAEVIASGVPPTDEAESAIVRTLSPGAYTAIVRGKNNTTGVALVEAYDLNSEASSRLANISTRGYVSTGDRVMIAGFILSPGNSKVVVRALGPSLEARGVSDVLQDPDLTIFDANGIQIDQNNSWKQEQQKELEELELGPGSEDEAAIVTTLPGGQYTAIVRGRESTRGVGLVEVYNIR